jgi:hypothetical protein
MRARTQGISGWVLLRSGRGQPVGGVQLRVRLREVGGRCLDTCLAAPAPLDQVPALSRCLPRDVSPPVPDLEPFQGQWARATVYVEQLTLHPPQPPAPSLAASRQLPAWRHAYHATYCLPGKHMLCSDE